MMKQFLLQQVINKLLILNPGGKRREINSQQTADGITNICSPQVSTVHTDFVLLIASYFCSQNLF